MSNNKKKSLKKYNHIITQSNSLVRGKKPFSLLDRQLFIYILSQINPFADEFKSKYRIYVKDFVSAFGKNRNSIYEDIENSVKNNFKDIEISYQDWV